VHEHGLVAHEQKLLGQTLVHPLSQAARRYDYTG
jgi:hypothetical protein